MTTISLSHEEIAELVTVASRPGYRRWREMVRSTGGCADPIHLTGTSSILDPSTGEILRSYDTIDEPEGRLLVACRNRRASRCPSCAETYRADTYHLIQAGLVGGKSVPDTVSGHPKVFATFTAPSFGLVHHRVVDRDGSVRRCQPGVGCNRRHRATDPLLGQAVDSRSYDYLGAVVWNALAGKLWHRTTTLIARELAAYLGVTEGEFRQQCRVSYGKVAEFQARGLVHFHVIVRLDGPDGPTTNPPDRLTVEALTDAIRHARVRAQVVSPDSSATGGSQHIRWGQQLDIQTINTSGTGDSEFTDQKVAGYIAKYATKGAESTGTLDRPVACWHCKGSGRYPNGAGTCRDCHGQGARQDDVHHLGVTPHAQAMISACWTLGSVPELKELRLRPWAHMLGFRGHFSTRSRRYSTTLTCLRRARQDWRDRSLMAHIGCSDEAQLHRHRDNDECLADDDEILVLGQWHYRGRGHSPGEGIYAATIRTDIAENRRLARQASSNYGKENSR